MDLLTVYEPELASQPDVNAADKAEGDNQAGTSTSPVPPTLDEELADFKKTLGGVGASLGGWWGKVQKQSADALNKSGISAQFDTARKDLASLGLLDKARKEAAKIGEQAREGYATVKEELEKGPDQSVGEKGAIVGVDGTVISPVVEDKGKGRAVEQEAHDAGTEGGASPRPPQSPTLAGFDTTNVSAFFNRLAKDNPKLTSNLTSLQSTLAALPHNVQTSVQSTLHQAQERNPQLAHMNLAEVQKLAEGYLVKGEDYLQGVGRELQHLVQDAVKVVPPDPNAPGALAAAAARREERRKRAAEALAASGGRREALLAKVRREPEYMLVDPSRPGPGGNNGATAFAEFCKKIEESGGLAGEAWKKKIADETLEGDEEGQALKTTYNSIVPSKLQEEAFWTRYFFRMHQIDEEEARRRVVLGAASQAEDDFSWDLEDESETGDNSTPRGDPTTPARPKPVERKPSATTIKPPGEASAAPPLSPAESNDDWGNDSALPSPTISLAPGTAADGNKAKLATIVNSPSSGRNSSEEGTASSFDVVSAVQSADEDGKKISTAAAADDGDDSDWE